MTSKPKIWTAEWLKNSRIMPIGITFAGEDVEKAMQDHNIYYDWKAWGEGEGPSKLFFDARDYPKKKKNLPNVMSIYDGYALLSEEFAGFLQKFDLGKTQLIEIPLFEYDQKTQCPGRHFLLNVAEIKSCVVPEKSLPSSRIRFIGERWSVSHPSGLAVLSTAVEGVDLWADPILRETLFLSDRLAKAIKKGKFGRTFLTPVEVVQPN